MSCGFQSQISAFLTTDVHSWGTKLVQHHQECMNEYPNLSQKRAWLDCYETLQKHLPQLVRLRSSCAHWNIIFEYELPRERGRRPDVIILAGDQIVILEFKGYDQIKQAHVDQTAAYARDIASYHAASHNRLIYPVLVLTKINQISQQISGVTVLSPDGLPAYLSSLPESDPYNYIDPSEWLSADYQPLPTLVHAARSIFEHEQLPFIRRAQAAGIPETVSELLYIAEIARTRKQHHIALVTGVPGAGKTLVGLQFVYQNHFNDQGSHRTAVFLSGNGKLITVLQDAIGGDKVFIQGVHGFLKQYSSPYAPAPAENIFVFDEAQRAWDAQQVKQRRGHNKSEPEDFLLIGNKKPWSLMVGLVGEGQEIYLGEESGLEQWNSAIAATHQPWIVHCPPHIAPIFNAAQEVVVASQLNLTASLRTHIAQDVQRWIQCLLENQLSEAAEISNKIRTQNFEMYITTDLLAAKDYVQQRYAGQMDKRYGLLASSTANNLKHYGVDIKFDRVNDIARWYNKPPNEPGSCCNLKQVALEFDCQGLELDFPIISWGNDLIRNEQSWKGSSATYPVRDPHRVRLNSYRVLLSRGRDGFIVFIPPNSNMKSTQAALRSAGLNNLGRENIIRYSIFYHQ